MPSRICAGRAIGSGTFPVITIRLMAAVFLAAGLVEAASGTAYISNCCNYPSTVAILQAATLVQTGQIQVGTGAWDAVFTPDGAYAYISNNVSGSVSVVQTSTQTVVSTIPLGFSVEWMAIPPDGKQVFVESFDSADLGHLVAIDTSTNTVSQTKSFPAPLTSPMAISPDSTKLYLCFSTGNGSNSLTVFDTQNLAALATIPVYVAVSVALTPDGKFAYVPNFGSASKYSPNVAVVDTASNTVVASIPLNPRLTPSYLAVSPDGSVAYVGQFQFKTGSRPAIAVIRTSDNRLVDSILLSPTADPGKIIFSPDGTKAYVTEYTSSAIDVFDVAKNQLTSTLPLLGSVHGLAISPDGTTLLAPNSGSSRASAVDTASGSVLASIPVGDMSGGSTAFPEFGGAAVSPDGTRAYFTNLFSGNVTVIETASNTVLASVPSGAGPVGIVLSPDGSTAYVAGQNQNSVTVINTSTFATQGIALPRFGYPTSLAITPDGRYVYVASDNIPPDFGFTLSYVFVIDTSTNAVVRTIIAPHPVGITISPDGTKAYVVCATASASLLTISTASNQITGTVALTGGFGGFDPTTAGIVVTPDGSRVFADDGADGTVWEIDTATNRVLSAIPVGTSPGQLALTPDGTGIWAADYAAAAVSVIDVASGAVVRTVSLGNPSFGVAFTPQ
jgi:YVTN family beta-propeller protein